MQRQRGISRSWRGFTCYCLVHSQNEMFYVNIISQLTLVILMQVAAVTLKGTSKTPISELERKLPEMRVHM